MLKLCVLGDDGEDIAIFGLSAMNLVKLQENNPIMVDMAEVMMPQHGRLFLGIRPEAKEVEVLVRKKDDARVMLIGLPPKAVPHLQSGGMLELDLGKTGVPGKLLIFYGTTEEAIMADLVKAGLLLPEQVEAASAAMAEHRPATPPTQH